MVQLKNDSFVSARWFNGIVAMLVCLSPFTTCLANSVWHTSTIKFLYPQGNGSFIVVFDADPPTCLAPSPNKEIRVAVDQSGVTLEGLKLMYAAALMGKAADRVVSVEFNDAVAGCYVYRMTVS